MFDCPFLLGFLGRKKSDSVVLIQVFESPESCAASLPPTKIQKIEDICEQLNRVRPASSKANHCRNVAKKAGNPIVHGFQKGISDTYLCLHGAFHVVTKHFLNQDMLLVNLQMNWYSISRHFLFTCSSKVIIQCSFKLEVHLLFCL